MKNLLLYLLLCSTLTSFAQNDYFFPANAQFDPNIPTPEQFLGYEVGDFHTRHDRVVSYMGFDYYYSKKLFQPRKYPTSTFRFM